MDVFASPALQADIHAFVPGEVTILQSMGIGPRVGQSLEVYVDGSREFAAGIGARTLLRDAAL